MPYTACRRWTRRVDTYCIALAIGTSWELECMETAPAHYPRRVDQATVSFDMFSELEISFQGIFAVVSKELLPSTSPFVDSEDVCGGGDRLGGVLPVECLRWLPGYFFSPPYLCALAAVSNELKVAVRDYRQWKGSSSVETSERLLVRCLPLPKNYLLVRELHVEHTQTHRHIHKLLRRHQHRQSGVYERRSSPGVFAHVAGMPFAFFKHLPDGYVGHLARPSTANVECAQSGASGKASWFHDGRVVFPSAPGLCQLALDCVLQHLRSVHWCKGSPAQWSNLCSNY